MTKLSSDEMIAKYGMNNAPDPNNLHVMAMDDGPRVVAELFNWRPGADVNELFDAARCPELYTIATKAHREFVWDGGWRGGVRGCERRPERR